MGVKKSYLERLAEIAREYDEPLRGIELVKSRLRWEDWATFRRAAVEFAREEIRRRKWRGARKGVVPGTRDAEDIADEVIAAILEGKGRVNIGMVPERLLAEIRRQVSQKVRVLNGLKETRVTRGEWDKAPVEGTERRSAFAGIGDERAKRAAEREELKAALGEVLKHEPELKAVLGCIWDGVTKPAEIARLLGMGEREVVRARRRLERRLRKSLSGEKEEQARGGEGRRM